MKNIRIEVVEEWPTWIYLSYYDDAFLPGQSRYCVGHKAIWLDDIPWC